MPKPGQTAATALVIASMIGTGVFTSLGYQLFDLVSGPQIALLWAIGGAVALCGAFCYAAVAEAHPSSGGEHHFLTVLFHPALGFMAGLLSAIVGFAAPTAASAIALGEYLHASFPDVPVKTTAIAVILLGTLAHAFSPTTSARVQIVATGIKLALIAAFISATMFLPGKGDIPWSIQPARDLAGIWSPAFAVALYFVFYSYSGWNAAVYGLEEWERPARTVRRALVGGTLFVTLLYIALNVSFLLAAPVEALKGQNAVGEIAATQLFGKDAGRVVSCLFAIGLFASVSAMLWAGPRVLAAMGRNVPALRFLTPGGGAPRVPLMIQTALAILFTLLTGFRELVVYTQTGLTLCTLLVAAGVFRLSGKKPIVAAAIFLAFTAFVIVRSVIAEPVAVGAGLATALACALVWFLLPRSSS
ncbi:APC family permease [Haloferula sargassicola]|uniref:Serine/threonine exchanger SteT n=1 Tax=Haloferula sargassicola TaxID=490096 RepID=A0ABP9UKU1_9BACT